MATHKVISIRLPDYDQKIDGTKLKNVVEFVILYHVRNNYTKGYLR